MSGFVLLDEEEFNRMRDALTRIANSDDIDEFSGDPGKWPNVIAAIALGWVQDEAGGPLHPPDEKNKL